MFSSNFTDKGLIHFCVFFCRYLAIVAPPARRLRAVHARWLMFGVWTVSVLMSLLPIMFWGEYQLTEKSTACKSENGGYLFLLAIVCFVIPLVIMVYCYTKVFLKVRRHKKLLRSWKKNNRSIKTEFKTTKIVFIVLTTFILAWSPFVIVYVLSTNMKEAHIPPPVFKFCGFLAAAHSMCNPIIYFTMNRSFRRDAIRFAPFLQKCFPQIVPGENRKRSCPTVSYEKAHSSAALEVLSPDTLKKLHDNDYERASTS